MTELRKLQLIQLGILCEVDRICRKHGLNYYLAEGTLLGAVRHKGFIPWDDDIDICMPFDDYKKFCKICESELNQNIYFLQTMDSDAYYPYVFAKLRLNNTLYVRKGQEHMKHHHGIYIDIFPLYPAPKGAISALFFGSIIARCKTIMWSPIGAVSEKKTFTRMMYKLLSCIPISIPRSIIYSLVSMCSGEIKENIGAPFYGSIKETRKRLAHVNDSRRIAKKKFNITDAIEMDFEGMKCFAPANYEYYLTFRYGNYMELPPENEQQGHHHASKIDFGSIGVNL